MALNQINFFDQFTNKYSLSKTLRFELKPVGSTQKMLEEENVFENDRIREEKYKQTKPFFDRLHRDFIKESLAEKTIDDLNKYYLLLKELEKNKKDEELKKRFKDLSKKLRTQVNNNFQIEKLFGKAVFEELKYRYGKEEESFLKDNKGEFVLDEKGNKISIFDEWQGFIGYFYKFQETRKNFYKDDGTSTAIATRIIDQNLKRFCENIQLFESIKDDINFKEVEDNFLIKLMDIFNVEYYNQCLLQNGIDEYNKILGGETKVNGEKIKGLNEIISKYRQDNKGQKVAFFELLDKQILSEKEIYIKNIESSEELLKKLKEFYVYAEEKTKVLKILLSDFFHHQEEYELEKIYISKESLNTILHKWMTDNGRDEFQKVIYEQTKKDKVIKFEKDDNSYKFQDFIALSLIKNAFAESFEEERIWKEKYFEDNEDSKIKSFLNEKQLKWDQFIKIFEFEFNSLFGKEYQESVDAEVKVKEGYDIYKKKFEEIINRKESDFAISQEDNVTIKNFVDNTLWIYQMGKYFAIEKKRNWLDGHDLGNFYNHPDFGYKVKFYEDAYEKIVKTRMLLQSYLTRKPFSTNKWKLNFENPTLADGWDKNKESDNSTVILRKDGRYYLAIMKKGYNKIFYDDNLQRADSYGYEKMVYKLLPGASKMLPKVFFSMKNITFFNPSKEILEIRNYASHTKNGSPQDGFKKKDFDLNDCHKMINFYKKSLGIHSDWKNFGFAFSDTKSYKDTSQFFKEVENQGYRVKFVKISEEYIKEKNAIGELFLFKIHNKDWNLEVDKPNIGKKNMHTIYFEALFSKENIDGNFPFKLNGEAELFYRPRTDEKSLGYKVRDENIGKWKKILFKKNESIPKGVVVDHRRYNENKIFLHIPITFNRTAESVFNYNQKINEFLLNNPDINIIGLDRGEKHLIYYAGIDQKSNLLKDEKGGTVLGSLNEINEINYYNLLEERAKGREKARQDWQNIENIKDLKRGYISLVVRRLADLIIEHNAILVFEDLNMRFKQIRGGIEKSVYQQLEKALIEKLNFLVNKGEKDPKKAGHLLRAFQLTAPFTTFKDMGKQTGVIFYTQASYTSKTCPECGFRPNVKWDQDNLLDKISITFSGNSFQIGYKESDFYRKKNDSKRGNILYVDKKTRDKFVLSTKDAIRYKWFRRNIKDPELNKGEERLKEQTENGTTIKYSITECFKEFFTSNNIDYTKNIKEQLNQKDLSKKFFNTLSFYLRLLTNTRNSVSGTNIDYINCPCCGFHSDNGFKGCEFNGDANGAYNIARKGILILEKISKYNKDNNSLDKMNWGDLFIGIEEWDKFAQNNKLDK